MRLRKQRLRCTQPSARSDELDQLVWAEVTRHLQRPDLILKACSAPSQEPLAHQDRQLTELRGQQRRLIDAYQSGAISLTELEARCRPLDDRVGELEQSARSAHRRSNTKAQLQHQLSEFSQKVANRIGTMTFTERQQLVRSVLEEVLITEQTRGTEVQNPTACYAQGGAKSTVTCKRPIAFLMSRSVIS